MVKRTDGSVVDYRSEPEANATVFVLAWSRLSTLTNRRSITRPPSKRALPRISPNEAT